MNFSAYWRLMRMDKPIGIFLLLWPTLWALWIASQGFPNIKILIVFILGTVLMRAAGCVINDIADRKYDKYVTRTKGRPLATGELSVKAGLTLFAILALLAFALVCTLNRLTILLSIVAVLLAMSYPLMKRFFPAPQLYFGMNFAWGIPMAFAAVQQDVPMIAWVIFFAKIAWGIAYDTMYAMVDRDDDIKIGIHSTALFFGRYDRHIIAILQGIFLILMICVAYVEGLSAIFYLGLLGAFGLFIYQHYLIASRERARCFKAFLNNNWVGFFIFLGLLFAYY